MYAPLQQPEQVRYMDLQNMECTATQQLLVDALDANTHSYDTPDSVALERMLDDKTMVNCDITDATDAAIVSLIQDNTVTTIEALVAARKREYITQLLYAVQQRLKHIAGYHDITLV